MERLTRWHSMGVWDRRTVFAVAELRGVRVSMRSALLATFVSFSRPTFTKAPASERYIDGSVAESDWPARYCWHDHRGRKGSRSLTFNPGQVNPGFRLEQTCLNHGLCCGLRPTFAQRPTEADLRRRTGPRQSISCPLVRSRRPGPRRGILSLGAAEKD